MQIQAFSIPMEGDEEATAQLNVFLRTHKVLRIEKVPVIAQGCQYWAVCVEFPSRRPGAVPSGPSGASSTFDKPKIDYRQIRSSPFFSRCSKLRQTRKPLADAVARSSVRWSASSAA